MAQRLSFDERARVERLDSAVQLRPQEHMGAVLRQQEALHFRRVELQPESAKLQLSDDLGPQRRDHRGAGREEGARGQLLGHARAPDHLSALKDQNPAPGPG